MRVALVVLMLIGGCAKTLGSSNKRGLVWAQPGTNLVFAQSYRETAKSRRELVKDQWDPDHSEHWGTHYYSDLDRVRFTAIDPETGAQTQLAAITTGGEPLYWDRRGKILWLVDSSGVVTGYSTTQSIATDMVATDMPLPFIRDVRTGRILNLWSGQRIDVGRDAASGTATVDGDILRLTRTLDTLGRLTVEQTIIGWTNGIPKRLADTAYTTPPLPPTGVRGATTVSADGRWFVEVVTDDAATSFIVHDLDTRTIAASIPLAPLTPAEVRGLSIYSLGHDRFVYGTHEKRELGDLHYSCLAGAIVVVDGAVVNPLPYGTCVTSVDGTRGRMWLQTQHGTGYVAADGKLLQLGTTLDKPLALGPTQIAYTVPASIGGIDVVTFDFATNTRTTVAHHASNNDTLLNVGPWGATFLSGDTVITEPASGAARAYTLPSADALQLQR
jgi:hypothetical protein